MTVGPEQAADLLKQATALHQAGWVAEASALYKQLLAHYPSHPDLLNLSGVAAHQLGDAAEAERQARMASGQIDGSSRAAPIELDESDADFVVTTDVSFPVEVQQGDALADQLQKLNQLLSQGVLTEEEYAVAKAKLLG